jgi:hypothetical protein
MVKAHHPDVDIKTITSGIPEHKDDGSEFTKADFRSISDSLRGISTRLAKTLKLERFFNAYDMEGNVVVVKIKSATSQAPSTVTADVPEVS